MVVIVQSFDKRIMEQCREPERNELFLIIECFPDMNLQECKVEQCFVDIKDNCFRHVHVILDFSYIQIRVAIIPDRHFIIDL